MNAVRDRHVAGQAPDWLQPRAQPKPAPSLTAQQIEDLKARWFGVGSLATTAVLAVGYALVWLMGVLP